MVERLLKLVNRDGENGLKNIFCILFTYSTLDLLLYKLIIAIDTSNVGYKLSQ